MNQKFTGFRFFKKTTMVQNINRLLYKKNWSIRQLSDQAGLPYESIKKLVGGKIKKFPQSILYLRFAMLLIAALIIFLDVP